VGSVPDLVALLDGPTRAVEVEAIPEMLGQLRQIEAGLWSRLLVEGRVRQRPASDEPLQVTVAEAARLLAYPVSYVRELTRKGELPCVRNGKYVRILRADLHAWLATHRDAGLAPQRYVTYHQCRDGERSMAAPAAPGSHTGPARRPRGRRQEQRGAVGARRDGDPRDGSAPSAAPGGAEKTKKEVAWR
jgi:excisionase family DNA binding protein